MRDRIVEIMRKNSILGLDCKHVHYLALVNNAQLEIMSPTDLERAVLVACIDAIDTGKDLCNLMCIASGFE